jgi:hypothetical protein
MKPNRRHISKVLVAFAFVLPIVVWSTQSQGFPTYRTNFFIAYPSAVGTVLDDVPSNDNHCGICHYNFNGGGARNFYGLAVAGTNKSPAAILGLGPQDSDTDGFTNDEEILDVVTFTNTPTFPGLKASNVGQVSNVALADIQDHLTPLYRGDLDGSGAVDITDFALFTDCMGGPDNAVAPTCPVGIDADLDLDGDADLLDAAILAVNFTG